MGRIVLRWCWRANSGTLILAEGTFCLGRLSLEVPLPSDSVELQTLFAGNTVEYAWRDVAGNHLQVRVFPASQGAGCWLVASAKSEQPIQLRLRWSDVCASTFAKGWLSWADPCLNKVLLKGEIGPSETRELIRSIGNREARITVPHPTYERLVFPKSKGKTPELEMQDDPLTLLLRCEDGVVREGEKEKEIAIASVDLSLARPVTRIWWGLEPNAPTTWQEAERDLEFQVQRTQAVVCSTPCSALDTAVPHVVAAAEGFYYPPLFVSGCLSWNEPYLGWNVYYGGIALGWAERLQRCFATYLAAQETATATDPYQRSPDLSLPGKDSHFYARGYINLNQHWYNMQELFFDQVIEAHAHRLLGDLWPQARHGLEEHVAWEKRCFDPENDGLYANGINAWATDSVWYSGGAGPTATAFNYRAHLALGRVEEARRIQQRANEVLWLRRKGWYAEYQEATPEGRLHESACLYGVCYPITCGMADAFQAWQLIHYARHELEQITFENHHGKLCWLSQWVPYEWSVRETGHGDTLTLALAAFLAGRADLGWEYLQGVLHHSQYDAEVPGGLQMVSWLAARHGIQGTDFAEPVSLFLSVLSKGLAGFRPVPDGPFRWAPSFPGEWNHARLEFPTHGVRSERKPHRDEWHFRQNEDAPLEFLLPLPGDRKIRIEVNGKPHPFQIVPEVGAPRLRIELPGAPRHRIVVEAEGETPWQRPLDSRTASVGSECEWQLSPDLELVELHDPQTVLQDVQRETRRLRGRVVAEPGHRVVFLKLRSGDCEWWQPLEVLARKSAPEIFHVPQAVPTGLTPFRLEPHFNGRLQDLCAPRCVAPRPQNCAAQIGIDGYGAWTHSFWKIASPSFDTERWHCKEERFVVDGIPFLPPRGESDAILVSQWQHHPRRVAIPFPVTLQTLYVLLAVNTNVMQSHMEVLRLTIETETGERQFPLIHPRDVWSAWGKYDLRFDRSCLPAILPKCVQLGNNLRGCLLQFSLPHTERAKQIVWECASPETIGALLGCAHA